MNKELKSQIAKGFAQLPDRFKWIATDQFNNWSAFDEKPTDNKGLPIDPPLCNISQVHESSSLLFNRKDYLPEIEAIREEAQAIFDKLKRYSYVAMNADGKWKAFTQRPVRYSNHWYFRQGGQTVGLLLSTPCNPITSYGGGWEYSLYQHRDDFNYDLNYRQ